MALRFFHGTTASLLDDILGEGLAPQVSPASVFRGNGSTIPGYTERMVYLTPVRREAYFYAQHQAEEYDDEPTILEVMVDADGPLRVDDDYISARVVDAAFRGLGMPPLNEEDFDEEGDVLRDSSRGQFYHEWSRVVLFREARLFFAGRLEETARAVMGSRTFCGHYYEYEETAFHTWRSSSPMLGEPPPVETTEPYRRVLAALRIGHAAYLDALTHSWQKSLATDRDPGIAYEGVIPPARLRVLGPDEINAAKRELAAFGRGRGRPVPLSHWFGTAAAEVTASAL